MVDASGAGLLLSPNIGDILAAAGRGEDESCRDCPWSPKAGVMAFGTSCQVHGLKWSGNERTRSMQIAQDPGDTTPASTGRLCFVCNSRNPTDRTAQNNDDLWRAAVALDWTATDGDPYLRGHYWTNAVLHGAPNSGDLRRLLPAARRCCLDLLAAQIRLLQPRVIVASGQAAASSLYELGVLSREWRDLHGRLAHGAHHETCLLEGEHCHVFCTYHTSARAVNQTASRLYNLETERMLRNKIAELRNPQPAQKFLDKYADLHHNGHRGMRVLLLHWLDIGAVIRSLA